MIDFSRLKEMDMLYTVLGAAAIVVVGLILIKIIAGLAKKALLRTGLDESMHKFIINVLKIVLYIIMIVVLLGHLKVPTAPLVTVLGAAGAAHCPCPQRQPSAI